MSISALTFTGISQFSDDFQAIVSRTVAIANLPVQRLESDQTTLLSKKTVMSNMRSTVANLVSSLESLGTVASGRAVSPASSSSKVSVSLNGTPSVGSYVISDVTSLATIASATSKNGYNTKDSTAVAGGDHTIDLVVGGTTHTISLTEATDNLEDLAAAINSGEYGVRASIIDTGATSGRYHLALTSTEAGPVSLSLRTTGGEPDPELMETTSAGSNAVFKINGQDVTSSTNSISSVVEGLIFTLNETTSAGETITISAQSSRNTLATALESVATAYNSLRAAIDAQTGESAGALAGDRVIYDIQARMRSIVGVSGADGNGNLAEVGLTMGADGKMTFDDAQLDAMGAAELEDAFAFLDNSPGSLGAFAAKLDQLSDAETGSMKAELDLYDETDERLTSQIETLSERVTALQSTLFSQLQAADALLAQLESQQSVLAGSLESLYLVLYGKNDG
jgi:flagellar hook-associated protein 2